MAIRQVTNRIFASVDYTGANVACIRTEAGLVLIDTPMIRREIDHWHAFIEDLDPDGPRYVILTHHHFDHITGLDRLGGPAIMHETARDEMMEPGGTLRESMVPVYPGLGEEDAAFILGQPLVQPEIVFPDRMRLVLGGLTIRIFHTGGHTPGSIAVYVEEDRVLLTGDNVTAGRHPFKGQADFSQWIRALRLMGDIDVASVVPGHGDLCGKDEIERMTEYFVRLYLLTENLVGQGLARKDVIEIVREKMIDFFEMEPGLVEAGRLMFDVGTERLYREVLGRGS
ncbi:MAG: MBL fold metallo-hydrolase [Proteobacteria bacterium]|nr:MBL fold metallo-hydrolase [Pseudomonadota bacterium]